MGRKMMSIALFGHMGSGKTTIADVLSRKGYQRISFAGPIKSIAELAYGKVAKGAMYATFDQATGVLLKKSGREILQGIGETIKAVDRDFWMRCFDRQVLAYGDTPLVVDDGRFMLEFDALRRLGWLTVGVNAAEAVRFQRYESIYGRRPTPQEVNHESEREVPDILSKCHVVVQGDRDAYDNVRSILSWRTSPTTT